MKRLNVFATLASLVPFFKRPEPETTPHWHGTHGNAKGFGMNWHRMVAKRRKRRRVIRRAHGGTLPAKYRR